MILNVWQQLIVLSSWQVLNTLSLISGLIGRRSLYSKLLKCSSIMVTSDTIGSPLSRHFETQTSSRVVASTLQSMSLNLTERTRHLTSSRLLVKTMKDISEVLWTQSDSISDTVIWSLGAYPLIRKEDDGMSASRRKLDCVLIWSM